MTYRARKWRAIRVQRYVKRINKFKKRVRTVSPKEMILRRIVMEIFPKEKIIFNERDELPMLELDIFMPERKIAFEYNGRQHYAFPNVYHKTRKDFVRQVQRDNEKRGLCRKRGILLVVVPYTMWICKASIESLLLDAKKSVSGLDPQQPSAITNVMGTVGGLKNLEVQGCAQEPSHEGQALQQRSY